MSIDVTGFRDNPLLCAPWASVPEHPSAMPFGLSGSLSLHQLEGPSAMTVVSSDFTQLTPWLAYGDFTSTDTPTRRACDFCALQNT